MTNQNLPCPFCHKPMQGHDSFMGAKLKEVYCDNDNCLIMGRLFDKELMNNRQPHPAEKQLSDLRGKVINFGDYLTDTFKRSSPLVDRWHKIFGTETEVKS